MHDAQDVHETQLVRSTIINESEIMEYIPERLIAEMGDLPTKYYDVQIIVTVVVTPLDGRGRSILYNQLTS